MQLKLVRSQKTSGLMGKTVVFGLNARLHLTDEEAENMKKYKLGDMVVYNSEDAKKHMAAGMEGASSRTFGGLVKSAAHFAMFKLSLNISLKKLVDGTYVECKDLNELLGAEEAIMQAAKTARSYLNVASMFDGTEEIVDVA